MIYKKLRYLRIVISLIFAICLGIFYWLGNSKYLQWMLDLQLVPAILAGSAIWLVLWVLVTISFGRIYCSTVCPMGTMMDIAGHCGRKLGKGPNSRYQYAPSNYALRVPIPLIAVLGLCFGFSIIVKITDPLHIYAKTILNVEYIIALNKAARTATLGLGTLGATLSIMFLIEWIAWRRGRLICNTVCPTGGLLGLLSRNPIYRIDINTDKCIHCGKCEDVCKSQCINLKDCTVDNSRCVVCFDCTAVCPNSAIILRRGKYKLATPMMQSTLNINKPLAETLQPAATDSQLNSSPEK